MAPSPHDILREQFGFPSFKGQQAEIIDHLVAGGDGACGRAENSL